MRPSLDIDGYEDDHLDPTITKDMYYKPTNRVMYYMIKDAVMDSDFHLIGNNMFRPDVQEPIIDHDVVHNIHKNLEYASKNIF